MKQDFGDIIELVKEFERLYKRQSSLEEKVGGDVSKFGKAQAIEYASVSEKVESIRQEILQEHEIMNSRAMQAPIEDDFTRFTAHAPLLAKLSVWITTFLMLISGYNPNKKE